MNIGKKIRNLRKERDVTQEKLAEYLGISYQAVSKWENGSALPDITLVVPLANFFGVSADFLFSINDAAEDEKIRVYEEKYGHFLNTGDLKACIALMREALAEYPRNYVFMKNLAQALKYDANYLTDLACKHKTLNEAIQLCERILEDCASSHVRNSATFILCQAYKDMGQNEKAIKTAMEMPFAFHSREYLLSFLYEGDKKILQKQENILQCIYIAAAELLALSMEPGCQNPIMHLEAAIKLYETIFYDGNLLEYSVWVAMTCVELAKHYVGHDTKKAIDNLLKAEKYALDADMLTFEPMFFTSVLVDRVSRSAANVVKSLPSTSCGHMLNDLEGDVFEPLWVYPEFAALKKRLEER
ncbi:MAG: helix-turn-helix domain-containing protein [Firmicutes bacterium]|nr:helix-turn-helix domain-containing protein [Bacillota bacterium]